jgi:peptidoglycan lytic transglycosylase G
MRRLGLLLLLLIAAAGACAAWLDHNVSRSYKHYPGNSIFVDIPHGTSRFGVAEILHRNGVIRSRPAFVVMSYWHPHHVLQAGEYLFDHAMTERQVFWKIAGGHIYVHIVQIPEGWSMFDIADELEREGVAHREDFLRVARDPAPIQDLAPQAKSLEGFLFPSTYQFTRHATPAQIAATMVRQFRTVWNEVNPNVAATTTAENGSPSVSEIVTMASLVERETPLSPERPLVAGVFYNRLKRSLPLQCDPTVQYALALAGRPTLIVRHDDLSIASPYNTYTHPGLPPGPIANPGEASLRAAINPAQSDYMYFVANDTGGHFFAKTLAEHNHNINIYRQRLHNDAAGDPASHNNGTGSPDKNRSQN